MGTEKRTLARSSKIKPCPFCGGKPEWVESRDEIGHIVLRAWKLQCSNCWCSPYPNNYSGNKDNVIERWNKRAGDDA